MNYNFLQEVEDFSLKIYQIHFSKHVHLVILNINLLT